MDKEEKKFMSFFIEKKAFKKEKSPFNASIDRELIMHAKRIVNQINLAYNTKLSVSVLVENLLKDYFEKYKDDLQKILSNEKDKILKL